MHPTGNAKTQGGLNLSAALTGIQGATSELFR
jgi:hypothetical protein